MTDRTETLADYRLPLNKAQMKAARTYLAPMLRHAPRNPILLVGALLVGIGGLLVWRNREAIARTASPIIEDARVKGHTLIEEALTKGHKLMEEAKATSAAISAKANSLRHRDEVRDTVSNVY